MSAEAATSLNCIYWFWNNSSIYSGSWIPKLGLLITEKGNVSGPIGVAKIVLLLLVVALENMNQLVATSAILGMMAVYLIIGIWWVSRKL